MFYLLSWQGLEVARMRGESPTGQGPDMVVTSTTNCINSNYILRAWGNGPWIGPWTRL